MPAELQDSITPLAEISQGPNAFEQFLDKNQKGILALAALVAIGGIATVVYRGVATSQQQTAGAALTKAEDLSSFEAVAKTHPKAQAAASALMLLANSQWNSGKRDESISTLQKLVTTYPKHPSIPSALASLGSKWVAQGKTGDATQTFEKILANPEARFATPFALISLGDIAHAAGDLKKAEDFFTQAKTQFPENPFVEIASRRLATLKAKNPTEVAPPPATTPATPDAPPTSPAVAPQP